MLNLGCRWGFFKMAKLVVPYDQFQEFSIYDDSKISIRFSIVTDDQNTRSYWSPIYSVDVDWAFVPGDRLNYGQMIVHKQSGVDFFNISWDSISIYKDNIGLDLGIIFPAIVTPPQPEYISKLLRYDLWTQWSDNSDSNFSNWTYRDRYSSTSVGIPSTSYTSAQNPYSSIVPKTVRVEIYRPGFPIKRYSPDVLQTDSSTTASSSSEYINFSMPHNINSHQRILFYSTYSPSVSLVSGASYWIAPLSTTQLAFYTSEANAIADTNRINLTSLTFPESEIMLKTFTQDASTVSVGSNSIVMNKHGFDLGDPVVYRSPNPIGGLQDEQLLWVRPTGTNTFLVYENYMDTRNYTLSSLPIFTSTGSGVGSFSKYPFLLYKGKAAL